MKSRGGQVTIFIILGLVILLLAGFLFFMQSNTLEDSGSDLRNMDAIEKYVSVCIEKTAKDGLTLMGMQGGYIDLPEIYETPSSYIQELTGGVKIPKWLFRGQFIIPTNEMMELELEKYVEDNLDNCLALDTLSSVELYESRGEINAEVSINEDDISVVVDYPIIVVTTEGEIMYDEFWAIVDLQLGDILRAGSYFSDRHYYDMFVDRATVNILSMDPDIPLGGMEFGCHRLLWSKREVQNKVQGYLRALIPTIRVGGTEFKPFKEQLTGANPMAIYESITSEWNLDRIEAEGGLPDEVRENLPDDMYEYLHMYWGMGDFNWNDINVGLSYFPSYGMTMNVNPSTGDRIEAVPGKSEYEYLRFLCINIYHFTYDIEYPIKVSLYDKDAFGGEGYVFNFALPVTIEHNIPTRDPINYYQMDALQTNPEFCNVTFDEPITIAAKDYYSGEFINDVKVTYDCIKYYCDVGETNTADSYGVPALRTNLPMGCGNPFFKLTHDNYIEIKEQVVDIQDKEAGIEFRMIPLKDFKFKVTDLAGVELDSSRYKSSVYMKNVEHNYEVFASDSVPGGNNILKLVDSAGQFYQVDVLLMNDKGIVGGWIGNLTVSSDDLSKDVLQFHVFEELPHPTTNDAQMKLFLYLEEDNPLKPYRDIYAPKFS